MKLLVVDDEAKIRNGLKQGIDWSTLGVEKVFAASDGLEAYDLFLRFSPEIIITDVRMPGLDGIELARKVREKSKATKILIVSAYSDFAYARQALQLGVNDYELKPLRIAHLIQIVKKFQAEIETEREHYQQEKARNELRKRAFLLDLIEGVQQETASISEGLKKHFQFQATGELLCLAAEIDGYRRLRKKKAAAGLPEVNQVLQELTLKYLRDFPVFICAFNEGTFFLVVKLNGALSDRSACHEKIVGLHGSLNQEAASLYAGTISLGVSTSGEVTHLREMANEALTALRQKLYLGPQSLIFYAREPDEHDTWQAGHTIWPDDAALREAIQMNSLTAAHALLTDFFELLKARCCTDATYVRDVCMYLQRLLIKVLHEKGMFTGNLFAEESHLSRLDPYETLDEYKQWVFEVYTAAFTELLGTKSMKYSPAILKALAYIRKNFQQDLNSEIVADLIKKSPSYFSHCFNKEVGMSFREYLNKIRVEEAKRLLRESSFKGYEIAQKVGFQDYTYFVQVFRKIEGVAPSEYRNPIKTTGTKELPPG